MNNIGRWSRSSSSISALHTSSPSFCSKWPISTTNIIGWSPGKSHRSSGTSSTFGPIIGEQLSCWRLGLEISSQLHTRKPAAWSLLRRWAVWSYPTTSAAWERWFLISVHRISREERTWRSSRNWRIRMGSIRNWPGRSTTILRNMPTSRNCSTLRRKCSLWTDYQLLIAWTIWKKPIRPSSKTSSSSITWWKRPFSHSLKSSRPRFPTQKNSS